MRAAFWASSIFATILSSSVFGMCGGAQDLPPPPPIQPPPTRPNSEPRPFHKVVTVEKPKADASPSDSGQQKPQAKDDDESITVRPAEKEKDPNAELIEQISALGSNTVAERRAALEKVRQAGEKALPVLLDMLDPKRKTEDYTRVEILRCIQDQSPLSERASRILAYIAVYDPFIEARREACRVIRVTADDAAIKQLVLYANLNDPTVRAATAWAAREVDYNALFQSLIQAMQNTDDKAMQKSVNTSITPNQDSPASEMMRAIARKNLGILSSNWQQWYLEKTGQAVSTDYHEPRSARSLMGKD